MKKSILLLLVLTFVFSTLCGVTVSANEAVSISLYKNTSFITSVNTEHSLIVTGLDANGNDVNLPAETKIEYSSSRPWVLDIASNGKFVDGGKDGSTIVTAKVEGLGEASLVFIKGADNGFNSTMATERKLPTNKDASFAIDYYEASSVSTGGHDNSNYMSKAAASTATLSQNDAATLKATSNWVTGSNIRIAQGWFYDDGTSDVKMQIVANDRYANLTDAFIVDGMSTNQGYIFAANLYSEKESYTADRTSTSLASTIGTVTNIERTKGWHQVTMIVNEDATIDVYLDGKDFVDNAKGREGGSNTRFYISGYNAGSYDNFVLAQNPNTEKPDGYVMPAKSLSLSANTSFYSSAVANGTELSVIPVDENGDAGKLAADATYEYESTRPWVIDVKDGKLYDGGNDGSTIITVTTKNSKGEEIKGSLVFIRSTSDTAITSGFASDNTEAGSKTAADGYAYYGRQLTAPTTKTDANSRVAGKPYISAANTGHLQYDGSWDKQAGIRIAQGWFYDDLDTTKAISVLLRTAIKYPKKVAEGSYTLDGTATTVTDGTNGYIPAWAEIGLNESIDPNTTDEKGYYACGFIKALVGKTTYSYSNYDADSKIKRTKGWHQATMIVNEDGTFDILLDGVKVNTTTNSSRPLTYTMSTGGETCNIRITSGTLFDDLVYAQNLNTTRPVKITVAGTENGTVTYGGEAVETVATHEGVTEVFEITPDSGYVVDKITYGDDVITPLYKDGKVSVVAADVDATLSVTFKAEEKLPSISATQNGNITYITIDKGNTDAVVTETGIIFGANGIYNRLQAYAAENTLAKEDGKYAIKVERVIGLTGTPVFTAQPYVTYTKDGQPAEEKSAILTPEGITVAPQ